jgi:hypothetical protein
MIKTEEKTIDGVRYQVTQFPAMEALRVQTQLLKVAGPALAAIFSGVRSGDGAKAKMEFSPIFLAAALEKLSDKLNEDELERLVLRLLAGARIMEQNGGPFDGPNGRVLFNMHFAGKLATLWKVIAFVLEVNYQDFFDGLKVAATGAILTDAAAATATLLSSAGSGGDSKKN